MRTRRTATIEDLRRTIDCLPRATKVAMLNGIRSNQIIVGAYSDENGICPMLAAHRAGGRTNFISFAKAWDRYAFRGVRRRDARAATKRELLVLTTHLEASLLSEEGPSLDFNAAIAEHRALLEGRPAEPTRQRTRRTATPARPGDRDRSRELRRCPGWSWMRIMRRYDDYERALALLESQQQATGGRDPEYAAR